LLPVKHGKHRLLDRLLPRPLGEPQRTVSTAYHGANLRIDINDLVGWHFAMVGSFDPEVAEILVAAAGEQEEVFWDVGANKGACSYAIAVALPRSKVVAIEPQLGLAKNLSHNLRLLCPDRFEHHCVGLSIQEATMELTIPEGNSGGATLHRERLGVSGRSESVRLITATTLVRVSRFGWPSLAKIDVEGHESEVIESLTPCLETKACRCIVFENHAADAAAFSSIYTRARGNGYEFFGISKTPFSTRLVQTATQLRGITDYMMVSAQALAESDKLRGLIAAG